MATAVTLKESDGSEIYPVTDISLVNNGIHAVDIEATTDVPPITAGLIDFSTMYISADTPAYDITVGSGAIIQTITLPAGKWRVFASFRLSCGGMTANQSKFFYCGFKNGTTTSSTNILQIPTNLTADVYGSGRGVVTMICKEITATSSYVVSSYVQAGDLPTSDLKVYRDPGIQLFAIRVG